MVAFPPLFWLSHPKGWVKTWFYCKNTALANENPLPSYWIDRLPINFNPPSQLIPTEHTKAHQHYPKITALLANELTGVDLARCWVSWKILP
jgi:hypothetical protein